MRINPTEKSKIPLKEKIDKAVRVIAIVVVFASTFIFFFKILFF